MGKWIGVACAALAAGFFAFALVVGVALWQGAALAARAASFGIEHARTALERTVPPEARDAARERLDAALDALREGRFDPAVLGEAARWLPVALADGRLDADERRVLWQQLDRLAPGEPVGGAPRG